jgi:hypothetical protein
VTGFAVWPPACYSGKLKPAIGEPPGRDRNQSDPAKHPARAVITGLMVRAPGGDRLSHCPFDGRSTVAYSPSLVSSSRLLTLAKIRS